MPDRPAVPGGDDFAKQARHAILGLAGATTAAADQAQAMTDEELAERLLTGRWTTIEVHEAGHRLREHHRRAVIEGRA